MTGEIETSKRFDRLEDRIEHLIHLVRSGGKDSRVTEVVPAWTSADADSECDFTGVKVPAKKLVKHATIRVHPGVADFADERGIADLTQAVDTVIPADYLIIPYRTEFREVYRPPTHVVWDKSQISTFTRPALMYLCGQLHVMQQLEERGLPSKEADFRRQTNGWLRLCLTAIADSEPIPDPIPIGTVKPGRKARKSPVKSDVPAEPKKEPEGGDELKNEAPGTSEKTRTPSKTAKKASKSKAKKASKSTAVSSKPLKLAKAMKTKKKTEKRNDPAGTAKKKSAKQKSAKKLGGSKTKPTDTSKSPKTAKKLPKSSRTKSKKPAGTKKPTKNSTKPKAKKPQAPKKQSKTKPKAKPEKAKK